MVILNNNKKIGWGDNLLDSPLVDFGRIVENLCHPKVLVDDTTYVAMLPNLAKAGFTLAEVLITLGIIGVVAAMTIPNLIANTNGAKYRSQFKKTISTLNQAGLMSQSQYGFDFAGTTNACAATGSTAKPDEEMSFCAILNGTLTGQSYVIQADELKRSSKGGEVKYEFVRTHTLNSTDTYWAYVLADGSIVGFNFNAEGCELPIGIQMTDEVLKGSLNKCIGFIDVNGVTLPNKEVQCTDKTKNTKATLLKVQEPCIVRNDANSMTDVFPIVFHDATVEPASAPAKYVLSSAK